MVNDEVIREVLDEDQIQEAIRAWVRNRVYVLTEGRTVGSVELKFDKKSHTITAEVECVHRRLPEGKLLLDAASLEPIIQEEAGTPRNTLRDIDMSDLDLTNTPLEEDDSDEAE